MIDREPGDVSIVAPVEYGDIERIQGPLVVVRHVDGVGWDESAEITVDDAAPRHGVVLDVDGDLAVVEVLEGTDGLSLASTRVAFSGRPLRIPVGRGWLGRVCNGRGEPIDGGPPVTGDEWADVSGAPLNPAERATPQEPIMTGIGVIDALMTLVRGQKLPVFSVG
ncbi:MAG: V-type ATP synthase subunit B, partial [Acidimicrobiales bacterium]